MTCEQCGAPAIEISRKRIKEPAMIEIKYECSSCHGWFYVWEQIDEKAD